SAKGARQGIEARGQFDAFMENVLPRDDVTFETDTLGVYRGFGYNLRIGGQARRSSTCTVAGSTLGPPRPTAILSGILLQGRERGRLSRTIGLLPNILFRRPRTTCWRVTEDLRIGTFTGSLLRETPLGATSHSYSRRALPASTRLLSELP